MNIITRFLIEFIDILNEMSPYLLLGFLFAGILKVLLPQKFIDKNLGQPNFKSVLYASLLGIPLPLCSCGVIPTGISIRKSGASKGATLSFLISTPQTGVDSILATYSLLGLPFAVIRPMVAFFTGVFGGVISNKTDTEIKITRKETEQNSTNCCNTASCSSNENKSSKFMFMIKYAFVDFLQDIAKWLIIGLLLAGFISVLIPDNFFEQFIGNQFIEMLVILAIAIPLYVCATGSIPIAAALMLKGLSPGAALVFLMAGPATNAAAITVIRKTIGKRAMWNYLISIVIGAFLFGTIINNFLPAEWFSPKTLQHLHSYHFMPEVARQISSIILIALIINAFYQKKKMQKTINMENKKIFIVNGMSCNHCKNSVEKHISALKGVRNANVDLATKRLVVDGENIDVEVIKKEIESLGFEYGGEIEQNEKKFSST